MTYTRVLTTREAGRWSLPAYAALRRRVRVIACAHAREAGASTARILGPFGGALETHELLTPDADGGLWICTEQPSRCGI